MAEDVFVWRLSEAEKGLLLKADKTYVDSIAAEVKGLRKNVIQLMCAIVGSSVMVSFTLLITLGAH